MSPTHPNRSRRTPHPSRNPAPDEIRRARENAGLTQAGAALLVHTIDRVWRQWEAGDRSMHPAFWDLFLRKVSASAP